VIEDRVHDLAGVAIRAEIADSGPELGELVADWLATRA
jgi:hypothetical protein